MIDVNVEHISNSLNLPDASAFNKPDAEAEFALGKEDQIEAFKACLKDAPCNNGSMPMNNVADVETRNYQHNNNNYQDNDNRVAFSEQHINNLGQQVLDMRTNMLKGRDRVFSEIDEAISRHSLIAEKKAYGDVGMMGVEKSPQQLEVAGNSKKSGAQETLEMMREIIQKSAHHNMNVMRNRALLNSYELDAKFVTSISRSLRDSIKTLER